MLGLILILFAVKVANYAFPEAIRFANVERWIGRQYASVAGWIADQPLLHTCPKARPMVVVPGGYVCAAASPRSVAARIFDDYPLSGGPREKVYAAISAGSLGSANKLMQGLVSVPRYAAVPLSSTAPWKMDPYHAVYWRFYYYSLRPTVSLLEAYKETGQQAYAQRLLAIVTDFFAQEARSPEAWADDHAVAFRAMVLAYEWWELRRLHVLTEVESAAFLVELTKTADFLRDPNHYQPEMNHGTNESAALLQLAVDFPGLPGAAQWLETARSRLTQSLTLLFDADGVLIENSPYYHLYELDKYWQIYEFGRATDTRITPSFWSRLRAMTNYATYILQPNDAIPLLGASLADSVHNAGSFAQLGRAIPTFRFVLTQGAAGTRPAHTSVTFRASGQTVMRSGWGHGAGYASASYLTFNVGAYRTAHSDLDALGITLYDNGASLLPAPGLYTYVPGAMRDYFHGTASHNTVVVDGRNQQQGSAYAGPLVTRGGITFQSGFSDLYDGVQHRRTVVMIDKNHFVVVDRLQSQQRHSYAQMFHLAPGARLLRHGLTVTGVGATSAQNVTITQLAPAGMSLQSTIGQTQPPMGLCSTRYQVARDCYALAYKEYGRQAAFTTLISVGRPDPGFAASYDPGRRQIVIRNHGRVLRISLGRSSSRGQYVRASDPHAQGPAGTAIAGIARWRDWAASGHGSAKAVSEPAEHGRRVLRMVTSSGTLAVTDNHLHWSYGKSNIEIRLRLTNATRIRSLTLGFSGDGWRSGARIELRDAYPDRYGGGWMTISLGRQVGIPGLETHWEVSGRHFSWLTIRSVRLTMTARSGTGAPPSAELESIGATPQQRTGAVVLVFDDGYESILPAARVLHSKHMRANVAVIGKYTELPTYGHLNVFELRQLQDQWGWNMVNHTQRHADAVAAYAASGKYGAYEQDILDNAVFLERAGLNSAPNWFIYPHGTTNDALDRVVGRLYKFARTTDTSPESYPYGSPLRVKQLELHSPGDGETTVLDQTTTPPSVVLAWARSAQRYHGTLMLTLHRIKATATDTLGYPLTDFKAIVNGLARLHIPVLTLSQLDALDRVPVDNHITVRPAKPSLITVAIAGPAQMPRAKTLIPWQAWVLAGIVLLCGLRLVALSVIGRASATRYVVRHRKSEHAADGGKSSRSSVAPWVSIATASMVVGMLALRAVRGNPFRRRSTPR